MENWKKLSLNYHQIFLLNHFSGCCFYYRSRSRSRSRDRRRSRSRSRDRRRSRSRDRRSRSRSDKSRSRSRLSSRSRSRLVHINLYGQYDQGMQSLWLGMLGLHLSRDKFSHYGICRWPLGQRIRFSSRFKKKREWVGGFYFVFLSHAVKMSVIAKQDNWH